MKSEENKQIGNKQGSTSGNVLGVQYTTYFFLLYVGACKCNCVPFPSRPHSMSSDKLIYIRKE